jgi:diguanylate cyclase (GGDEF)-like protein
MQNDLSTQKSSYQNSLKITTFYGAVIGACFELGFSFYYGLTGFPLVVVGIQIFASLISLSGLVLIRFLNRPIAAAHLVTLGLFSSLFGAALYTGGINSSSIVWLVLVPVVSALMAGKRISLIWSVITILSLVGILILNRFLWIDLTIRPSDSFDRFIDLACVIVTTMLATWLNEITKQRTMYQLEDIQSRLEALSIIDPLTQTYNRRYFYSQAEKELTLARQNETLNAILLIDIDHFKEINDTYGHFTGDQVLCGAVNICTSVLRKEDILARFGGEEFVIFLPQTLPDEARRVAERLRAALEKKNIETDFGPLNITVSIGLTDTNPKSSLSLQELIHQADTAMYQAKRAGRNRVIPWDKSFYPPILTGN